jgi:5-methyltetrahydrofolate--homocysteine methyltransferase
VSKTNSVSLSRAERVRRLLTDADARIMVLDGATGTALQGQNLTASDFGGADLEGCNENLVLSKPSVVEYVHRVYLEAGCDIVETNTFGATPMVLDEYKIGAKAYEINKLASEIARTVCAEFDTAEKLHYVAGSMGPTTKALSLTGGITFEELVEQYYVQALGLFDGGSDYYLIETCNDTRNVKAALIGIDRVFAEKGEKIPVAVSATIESTGTMLGGQSVEALTAALMHRELLYLGLNCATGPEFMTDHIRSLAKLSPFRVACVPNAGLPDEDGCYLETPQMVSSAIGHFIEKGWVNFVGGCCGTHPGHVTALVESARHGRPHDASTNAKRSLLSGIDHLEITDDLRPVIVGERTNVIGSKKFKDLIRAEKYDDASEIARHQVKAGAHIIDVCLADPDREELIDTELFLDKVVRKIRAPIMIDSTDAKVVAKALTYCQGKAIINSINLEDGEERFDDVVPLAKKFGAALVVGTIDEDPAQGMGVTRERKLEIATRSFELLTGKYGIPAEDIYFDPLVFPCGTGDEQYRTSAPETIEGLRLIKQKFPKCKTILGISNVSFGLPGAGREVLNSVFLYHCVQAGLDLAIVNSEKLERFASLDPEDIKLAEDLLFSRSDNALAAFAERFRDRKGRQRPDRSTLPLDERLSRSVIEGTKDGLVEDLTEALKNRRPLEIINGPLMAGMDEVGKLFNANKLIVAEVLQSAEVMKASVSFLEAFMEKADTASRGKIVLATVKGDVHDIGKNLVDIILSNNGYNVVNLGIKIPPEQLIAAVRLHKPDMIGLSGLLVKSAHQMVTTAEDLARAGINIPILVGGAALSRGFTEKRILPAYQTGAVIYAQDAMNGLDIAHKVMDPISFDVIKADLDIKRKKALDGAGTVEVIANVETALRPTTTRNLPSVPQPPDFKRHIQKNIPVDQLWKFINPLMLYTRHLGVKARSAKLYETMHKDPKVMQKLKEEDPKAFEIWEKVEEVKEEFGRTGTLMPSAIYRFFRAASEGNDVVLFEDEAQKNLIARFKFERQSKGEALCLSDYLKPRDTMPDSMAMFVTTAGHGVRDLGHRLRAEGQFLKSHIIQALAIETAEGYAEWLHTYIRSSWGVADGPNTTMLDRFQAKYHGKRYSFGYPACPRLEDQTLLFELLHPQDIGVQLTEGFMMDPEACVSAIVFHHPDAKYFGVAANAGE